MFRFLKRLGVLFGNEDRWSFFFLALATLFNSLLEVLGIGLMIPFISLLAHPEMLDTNVYLRNIYHIFSFHSFLQFTVTLDVVIIAVFVVKNAVLLLVTFLQTKFIFNKQSQICSRLFQAYLLSPYSFHLQRNLGHFQEKLRRVEELMQAGILSVLIIFTEGLLVACLFMMLIRTNPILTIIAMAVLSGGLMLYFRFLKDKLYYWGEINGRHGALAMQQVNQGLGSIKESKLLGKELFFVKSFYHYEHQKALQHYKSDLVIKSPRLFIETAVVAMVMSAMAICLLSGEPPRNVFATISVFAIVTLRLMPSLNRISSSWGGLRFFIPSFDAIYEDLTECEKLSSMQRERTSGPPLVFHKEIQMKNVVFFYENAKSPALNGISLTIMKNSVVGFIGPSGAGKTSAIDVMLGLLDPSSGRVTVDGVDIHSHLRSWQTTIGYIPQVIYLCDDTIRRNVAFGMEMSQIDDERVWRALRLAQMEEVVRSLPQGIETTVGERGVRLSGGQRQRIGIARALYHDPQVLVMDEATAALDNETERLFMSALFGLSKEKTIIIIAHRLTTVQQCDHIFFLKNGQLIAEGRYDELSHHCPEFHQMEMVKHF
ncbi:MAG: ABC transporter ATP-binding protein [Candidatus Omnitrophica bacterium]|nr:ABC transporter ATP-binding protein [Candidatus Omnitrophota bacterium]MDE2223432.1 ABC transporter ATP-binding protein [Candidatus Omnitrophota bacterium]